jgi:hypothetical protein
VNSELDAWAGMALCNPAQLAFPPSAFCGPHGFPEAGPHLRQSVGIPAGLPVSLSSVVDPPNGERPGVPLPSLVQLAIYETPAKSLTLQGVYKAIAARFKYFRVQDDMGIMSWRVRPSYLSYTISHTYEFLLEFHSPRIVSLLRLCQGSTADRPRQGMPLGAQHCCLHSRSISARAETQG